MTWGLRVYAAALTITATFLTTGVHAEPINWGKRLRALYEEDWDAQMRDYPTWASPLGDHRFDHLLEDASLAAQQRREQRLTALVEE